MTTDMTFDPTVPIPNEASPLMTKLREAELLCVNFVEATSNLATGDHLHPRVMHLTCALAGRGVCVAENGRYEIAPGGLHVVYPGVMHRFCADSLEPYTKYVIKVRFPSNVPQAFPHWIAFGRRRRTAEALLRRLHDAYHTRPRTDAWALRLQACLFALFAELLELTERQPDDRAAQTTRMPDPFADVLADIQQPPFCFPGLDALASRANLSRRAFTERFRHITGCSPYQFYQRVRLSHARLLIESGDYLLKEVAFECGFANSQNLVRAMARYDDLPAVPAELIMAGQRTTPEGAGR